MQRIELTIKTLSFRTGQAVCLCCFCLLISRSDLIEIVQPATAETVDTPAFNLSPADSVLLRPGLLSLYDQNFSKLPHRARWQIRIHGLRFSALHPLIWGQLRSERTLNRNIVPIRPLYLRISENPRYAVEKIELTFRYKPIKQGHIGDNPNLYDPQLDIGFGGQYERGLPGEAPFKNQGYLARFTAIPVLESGIYYRSREKLLLIRPAAFPHIRTGQRQKTVMIFDQKSVQIILNGKPYIKIQAKNLNRGLISLSSGWHPLKISTLKISGSVVQPNGSRTKVVQSGLVKLRPLKGAAENEIH
jgi:hypothetical protein